MSQTRLSLASELMLVHTDPQGLVTWVNAAFTARMGFTLSELQGRELGALMQGVASDEPAPARLAQALRDRQPCRAVELVNYRKDGSACRLRVDIEPQFDARGAPMGFVAIQQEVIEVPPLSQRQLILKRWHEASVGEPDLGFFERNIDTDEIHWDERMYALYDRPVSLGPLDRQGLLEAMLPEDANRVVDEWLASYPRGYSHNAYRIRLRDGGLRWLRSDWTLLRAPDGTRLATGSTRDITAAVERQQVAAREHSQLLLAAELGQIGLMTEIAATRERQINAACLRIYGFKPGQMPPYEEMLQRVHPDDRARLHEDWQALRSGAVRHNEGPLRVVYPDGRVVHVLERRSAVGGVAGKPLEFVAAAVDITETVQARLGEEQSRESRVLALELAGLSVWELSADGSYFSIDGRMLADYGWEGESARVPAQRWLQAVHPADRARMAEWWERSARGERLRGSDSFRIVRPDGEVRWLDANFASIQQPDGTVAGLRGTMLDVTERQRLQAALQRERELLAETERLAHVGAWRREVGSDHAHWSAELYRLFRRDPARGPSRLDERHRSFTPESWARLSAAVEQARLTGRGYELEIEICRDDGTHATVRHWAEFERDAQGTVVAHRGCAQDISDIVAMRTEAELARQRLQALFDGAHNGIFLIDDDARFVDVNPAACEMLGYDRDALLQRDVSHVLVVDETRTRSFDAMALFRRFVSRRRATGRLRLRCKDGGVRVVEFNGVACIRPAVHLAIVADVTARVQTERALEQSQARLRELTQRREEDSAAFRAELAREVHDQLGQTLGALKLEIDYIATAIPEAAQRMRKLIQEGLQAVRDVSRSLRPAALDMGLAPALAALAQETSMRSEVDVSLRLSEPMPAEPDQTVHALYRIAQEAVANAVRHAQAHAVTVSLGRCESGLQLEVRDDGRGFDPSSLPLQPGLGVLGMAERARQIGAHLLVLSKPGAGTTIQVRWPAAAAAQGVPTP
jgi:PAS domain S-box-containing protein